MDVNLFYLVPSANLRGGDAAFTVHLTRSFEACGIEPHLYRVVRRCKPRPEPYTAGVWCQRIDAETAVQRARERPSVVAYCISSKMGDILRDLMHAGAVHVVHAAAELPQGPFLDYLRLTQRPVVAIRKALADAMRKEGVNATFIKHPYVRSYMCTSCDIERPYHAVSMTRVDFCKKTEIVADANQYLPPEQRIDIWGNVNRMYCYHILDKRYPYWRDMYRGPFNVGDALPRLRETTWAVDLTTWKNDKGGSQYCFMEAWDAGAALVVNKKWTSPDDEMRDLVNCVGVRNGRELASVISGPPRHDIITNGELCLEDHAPEYVVPQYIELMEGRYA